jgi:hypothetical protein
MATDYKALRAICRHDLSKQAFAELEKVLADAARYRWLRDDNAYAPEEALVRGGEELDKLCDDGIARSGEVKPP